MSRLDGEPTSTVEDQPYPAPPCTCLRTKLAGALDAITSLEPEDLETVLTLAEAQRADVRRVLAAALEAEATHLADLSRQAYAAADRLVPSPIPHT